MSPSGQRGWGLSFALGALMHAGCAGDATTPVTPASSTPGSTSTVAVTPQISSISDAGIMADSAFAAYDIVVNPATMQAEILPLRVVQAPPPVGQKFVVDMTNLLSRTLCDDCLQISGLRLSPGGHVLVDLGLRHPIAAPNISQGIGTASLHLNNVRGFVVSRIEGPDGILGSLDDPKFYTPMGMNTLPLPQFTESLFNVVTGLLTNADGYSRDVTPLVAPGFDTLYPYVIFGESPIGTPTGSFGVDGWTQAELAAPGGPTGYNVWAQGSTVNGTLDLDLSNATLGTNQVTFRFITTASYVVSRKYFNGVQGSKLDPLYFMPEGALMSPWRVTVDYLGTDGLGGQPREGTNDLAQIAVKVRDWQKAIGSSNTVPSLTAATSPTGLLGPSQPKDLLVDIPGILLNPLTYNIITSPAAGTELDPIVQVVSIPNNPAALAGPHIGFIRVVDERSNGPIIGTGETFDLYETGGANKDLVPFNISSSVRPYATYQLFEYPVADTAVHALIDYMAARVSGRLVVDARGSSFDAPNSSITTYDYVFDYGGDPTEFSTPSATSISPILTVTHAMPAGPHTIGLRVTSNLGDTDINSMSVDVQPARDPFVAPTGLANAATGLTSLRFGVQAQDFNDASIANPSGGDNLIQIGDHLYAVFYGNIGLPNPGLNVLRSLDGGTSWLPPTELISSTNPSFTQYGGASITGARDNGQDRVVVALGTINYLTAGTGRILLFENPNASGSITWTQTIPESYALSPTQSAACSPAIAMSPLNPGEIHLVYGFDTGGTLNGILRRWRVRSSLTGVAGMGASFQTVDGTAADAGWMTDATSSWCTDMAVHPLTGRAFMLLGNNTTSYVLRTDDNGSSWNRPLAQFFHGGPFYRDGDIVMDPWLADTYYVARNRRGAQFADPFLPVLRGTGNTLTAVSVTTPEGARSPADMSAALFDTGSGHVALAFHETGELEVYWTEANGPTGAGTYMNGPHIQMDMLSYNTPAFLYHPDRTINGTSAGTNPSVEVASDGGVHVLWQDAALGRIYYRRG